MRDIYIPDLHIGTRHVIEACLNCNRGVFSTESVESGDNGGPSARMRFVF